MSQFENQQQEAQQISRELAGALVALGVDWQDSVALRRLAREALAYRSSEDNAGLAATDFEKRARLKFYGLVALMYRTMEEGATEGEMIHGSDVWKAVSRALWAEKDAG